MGDADRQFWNPEAQTLGNDELLRRARAGFEQEWHRVWDRPIDFYRKKFEAAGLGPDHVPALDDIPRTTKDEWRADEAAHPLFGTHRVVGPREAIKIGGSTGTSGTPVYLMFGAGDVEQAVEHQCRVIWRYGLRPHDSITHSWPQGFYMSSTFTALWYTKVPVLEIPVGPPMSVEDAKGHLRTWVKLRPDCFMMTSSQLLTYEDAAEEEGIDLRSLFEGRSIGLLDAIFQFAGPRERLEAKYGFRIFNMGGAGEVPGFGVTDCQHHTGLHVPGDQVVPQVVDPATGKAVPDGERGHFVLNIHGFDQFVVRYDVEDICTMTWDPCPCGETGPRYTLLGRSADVVEIDGRRILPIDAQLVLHDLGAPEFQFASRAEQDGRTLRVRVEGEGAASQHGSLLRDGLGVPVDVIEVPPRSLPRSTFKPRRSA
jgi:phenylacetate-CoA ligase